MQINRDPHAALRSILISLEVTAREHKAQVFAQFCGPVTFSGGTYRAKCCRITATCTEGPAAAVIAWARKARDVLEQEVQQ